MCKCNATRVLPWLITVRPTSWGEGRGGGGDVMKTESGKNGRVRSDAGNWAKREYELG